MFSYISGKLMEKDTSYVVVDVLGVGFKIYTSANSLNDLTSKAQGEDITLHTYLYIKEGIMDLYGFCTKEELTMFTLLLSVSGIGAKGAVSILSSGTPSQIAISVVTGDINTLTKAQGVGKKTAQRIILDLKDKIKNESITSTDKAEDVLTNFETGMENEAISALMVLGYNKSQAEKAVLKVNLKEGTVEDIIKAALKILI